MKTPVFLFEDHCESYIHWKDAGLKGLTVVHVDAHLDVMTDGLSEEILQKIASCSTGAELEKYRKNDDILWGGFHPGNYLFPAIKDGTVSKLIWVVPDHLPGGEELLPWARGEVSQWIDFTLADYDSLRYSDDGRSITGKLLGGDFEICTLSNLSCNDENIAWDIDIDYMIDKDDVAWISPEELIRDLGKSAPSPQIITIAYSVNGGYLPPEQKYLGDMVLDEARGIRNDAARETFIKLREADRLTIKGEREEARLCLDKLLPGEDGLFKPYIQLRKVAIEKLEGHSEKEKEILESVGAVNPALILHAYDIAMIHFRRLEYEKALAILDETAKTDEVHFLLSHFISAVIYIKKEDYVMAGKSWKALLESEFFSIWPESVRAHILYIAGSTAMKENNPDRAKELLDLSIQLNPENPPSYHQRGVAFMELKDYNKAARDFRKFLWLKPGTVETMEVHLLLAETYKLQEKPGLAKLEAKKVIKNDTTGFYSIKARLGRYR